MRSPSIVVVCALAAASSFGQLSPEAANAAAAAAPAAMKTITAADLERRLRLVASDEMQGRLTATPAQTRMAHDMAAHFQALGLEPLGEPSADGKPSWFQGYPVKTTEVTPDSGLYDPEGKKLNLHGAWSIARKSNRAKTDGQDDAEPRPAAPLERPKLPPDGVPPRALPTPPDAIDIRAKAVYFGRIDKQTDFAEDLSKVIPIVSLTFDTSGDASMEIMTATMRGMQNELGSVRQVASQLESRGALCGVILVPAFNLPFLTAANTMLVYPGKPSVKLDNGKRDPFGIGALRTRIPILILSGPDAEATAQALGISPERLGKKLEAPIAVPSGEFRLLLTVEEVATQALNTVGILRGRDEKQTEQAIIYSAHMDHVGMAADGTAFNGADDDGSGTVTLMELAEAYAGLPKAERPARSVIFLSVSGEELGLWGSAHYANAPTWPADKMVANINLDMIGRSTDKVPSSAIAVTPTHGHRAYSSLGRDAAFLGQAFGLTMANGDRFYTRSDHYNFAKKGIPVVFFCDDEHPDYHLPSDDPDKIEYEKMERVGRLAFLLGYRAANAEELPRVLGKQDDWFTGSDGPEKGEGR